MSIGQIASTGKQAGGGGGGSTTKIYEVKFETTVPNGKLWIKFISSQKLETATEIENYFKNYSEIDVTGCFVPTSETVYSADYIPLIPFAIYPRAYDWNVQILKIKISAEAINKGGSFYGYTNIGNIVCREV